jgi:hypothetical protein
MTARVGLFLPRPSALAPTFGARTVALEKSVCLRCVSRVGEATFLGAAPSGICRLSPRVAPDQRRNVLAERAYIRIAQRDSDLSNWNACRIEQLACGLEAHFIEQFLERRALLLESPVQRAVMHQQEPGDLIAGPPWANSKILKVRRSRKVRGAMLAFLTKVLLIARSRLKSRASLEAGNLVLLSR